MAAGTKQTTGWRSLLILAGALVLAGCNSSSRAPSSASELAAGVTIVPPLTGEVATNRAQAVERLRHLPKKAAFEGRTFTSPNHRGAQIKYLLFIPRDYQTSQVYPLVLSLHGGAPRRKFEDLLEPYLPGLAYGLGRFISDETQNEHPSFIIAPWSNNQGWEGMNLLLVMELLDSLHKEFPIDAQRRYITGQSMGGFGTWSFITSHPGYFAAAIPICGGGNVADVPRTWDTPVWAFHGTADKVVPVKYTRQMIAALRKAGGAPRYWEYQEADHAQTAESAYCEPELISWLFAQRKP